MNPVSGAAGLLWTGSWHVCQSAVETVLRGGVLRASPEFSLAQSPELEESNNNNDLYGSQDLNLRLKRKAFDIDCETSGGVLDLGITTTAALPARMTAGGRVKRLGEKRRQASPQSDESDTTTLESGFACRQDFQQNGDETKLLRLFF